MWTEQSRGRMAKIARKTKRYPSDLTERRGADRAADAEAWASRPSREVEFREVINAVRYLVRSGSAGGCCGPLRPLANHLWLVPGARPPLPVPDPSRCGTDAGPGAGRTRGEPLGGGDRQPIGQSSARQGKGLRCRQEDRRAQAPHRRSIRTDGF